jgi:hypothetical protein
LQGAVRLHGLRSSPTPDTQVRVACAFAAVPPKIAGSIIAKIASKILDFMTSPLLVKMFLFGRLPQNYHNSPHLAKLN